MAQKKVPPAVDGVPSGVTGRADSPDGRRGRAVCFLPLSCGPDAEKLLTGSGRTLKNC